ncbi:hypothetical protein SAMN04488074_10329 [Lentzea albidocapillata subsp. violacea]|uniref:Secreted protein n=1 Tax=Lentzea albidocapillata subsp. violacea TaxID=128104 RepID=A0A1G8W2X0_9PSEU|nr:hypothetical protein [Lentzea albidocapillata]SDJ71790.1 hypothetical protein SAMN04488074_10329 [Lentzea albidocapillata subsp. violacea]
MINKPALATAVIGGVMLAATASVSAGQHDHHDLCAAPWQWNGPLSLLHEGHTSGYAACNDNHAGGRSDISVLDDACVAPWQWIRPVEIFTVDQPYVACNGDSAG